MGPSSATTPTVLYIGAPEAPAEVFASACKADFPDLTLFATDDRTAALSAAHTVEAIIAHHFQFDDPLLLRATQLRWIQSLTTGTDAITRLAALKPEVIVTSTRGMHGPQMSELVFLHMLALTRDFPRMLRNQANRVWERWPQPLLWRKTVVIVGVGAIAEALATRCRAFEMTVVGVSESPRIPSGFHSIYPRRQLRDAAAQADFLVLLVPHSAATEGLVDEPVIRSMKGSAYLINAARGGVLDEHALLQALKEKRIAGAGLDVFRQQPLPADSPLWQVPGALITPLLGGMSDVYLQQAYPIVRDNLRHFLDGQLTSMINIVHH